MFSKVFSMICSVVVLMLMLFFSSIMTMDLCISYTEVIEIGWKYFTIKAETKEPIKKSFI